MTPLDLPASALLAIAAVAWADGFLRKSEAQALLRVARAAELSPEDYARVQAALDTAPALDALDLEPLTGQARALAYAIATWLAKLDGVTNTEELANLKRLQEKLGLPKAKLDAAASATFDVMVLPGGGTVDGFDLGALAARLTEKLPSLSPRPKSP